MHVFDGKRALVGNALLFDIRAIVRPKTCHIVEEYRIRGPASFNEHRLGALGREVSPTSAPLEYYSGAF
jgi:hypothetical protein